MNPDLVIAFLLDFAREEQAKRISAETRLSQTQAELDGARALIKQLGGGDDGGLADD